MDNTPFIQFPEKLGNFIFYDLNAIYEPDFHCAKQNLNADEKQIRKYLGTYFLRSFTEINTIFTDLIKNCYIKEMFEDKEEIHILDIGGGTGANLLGLLWGMKDFYGDDFRHKDICIVSIDGNIEALKIQEILLNKCFPDNINLHPKNLEMCRDNFKDIIEHTLDEYQHKEMFDIITAFKFVNELYTNDYYNNKGMYRTITETISDYLIKDGLYILSDVTYPIKNIGFLPNIMNSEISNYLRSDAAKLKPIIPLSCAFWHNRCRNPENCFIQRKIRLEFNKNLKSKYRLKGGLYNQRPHRLTYKVFAHAITAEEILENVEEQQCYRIAEGRICEKGNYLSNSNSANKYKDAFSFNYSINGD
jgi:hypothetical protein